MTSSVVDRAPLAMSTIAGTNATRYDTWMSGWVRKTVSTLMSSCEWCSSWKRHSIRTRWLARWADQLQASIATKITAVAAHRGTASFFGSTIHGTVDRARSANDRLSAVTNGTTSATLRTVHRRS